MPGAPGGDDRVQAAIDRWQHELLDLSRNNRLLYFQAGAGRRGQGGVRIAEPAPTELFERLANREHRQIIARPPATAQEPLTRQSPLAREGEGEPTRSLLPSSSQGGGAGGGGNSGGEDVQSPV